MKTYNKSRVIGLSLALLLGLSTVLQAGRIGPLVDQLDPPAKSSGYGGWDLSNVDVKITDLDFTEIAKTFDKTDGSYSPVMVLGDSFESDIYDSVGLSGAVLVNLHGKNWPVGEPAGIKVMNSALITDTISHNRPASCIMTTSFLEGTYLDAATPVETKCDSDFQTHKRFKFNMLPTMVDTIDGEGYGKGVNVSFNVEAEVGTRRYMLLQKINNYTGKRLDGYKVEIGFLDVDGNFTRASDVGADLRLSIGLGENDGEDIWTEDKLASFSHGLFGAQTFEEPVPHFPEDGFFDSRPAGFYVELNTTTNDTIKSTGALPNNYAALPVPNGASVAGQFGNWLPNDWAPKGIFWDDDNDPATDNTLMAFWGDTGDGTYAWMKGDRDGFAVVPNSLLVYWASTPAYSVDVIEDVLNLGLTYIIEVGDISTFPVSKFTIRTTPHVDTNATVPGYVTHTPPALTDYVSTVALVSIAPAPTFSIGSNLDLVIADIDLLGIGTKDVNVSIAPDNVWQMITLSEIDNRAIFTGSLTTAAGFTTSITGNNLTLKEGSVVTVSYHDDSEGLDVTASTTATVAPIVSNTSSSSSSGPFGIFSTMDDVSLLLMILGFLTIGGFIVRKRLRRQ